MTETTTSIETTEAIHSATYCPEDNKLRLYPGERLDSETFQRVKQAGFKWAPKQEIFVAPAWTPSREDLLLELCGEIGDEDYSPEERAADRAERFAGYRDKRRAEAHGSADRFDAGPSCFGHQNAARAERQARRHDRHRSYAVSQWSKAEYWQTRTQAVIGHALYKSSAGVRRQRLLKIEAEQRKNAKELEDAQKRYGWWQEIAALSDTEKATRLATRLAGSASGWTEFDHPRTDRKSSLYGLLTDPQDPITGHEAAALYLAETADPGREGGRFTRWAKHYELRAGYEKAMIEAEGGMAGEVEMIPGGWIRPSRRDVQFGRAHVNAEGFAQILKVNKSPSTGRVTSVQVMGDERYLNDRTVKPRVIKVDRLGEDAYRAPTPEELEAFEARQKAAKAKAKQVKKPSLVNPTPEDAERLQAIWNANAKHPSEVWYMTQAEYSNRSKGSYSPCETVEVTEKLKVRWGGDPSRASKYGRVTVFKLRRGYPSGQHYSAAPRVVCITDKPQKPLPWEAVDAARAEQPTREQLAQRLEELNTALTTSWENRDKGDNNKLISDAAYCGLAYVSSVTQYGWTTEGAEWYREQIAQHEAANA